MNAKIVQLRPQQITPKIVAQANTPKVIQMPVRQTLMRRAA